MDISEQRKAALYKAISDPIMKRRISAAMSKDALGASNAKKLDEVFYKLEREIWTDVKKVLEISDTPAKSV